MVLDLYSVAWSGDNETCRGAGLAVAVARNHDDASKLVEEYTNDEYFTCKVVEVKLLVTNVSGSDRGVLHGNGWKE